VSGLTPQDRSISTARGVNRRRSSQMPGHSA
jgi:hypothetical protein